MAKAQGTRRKPARKSAGKQWKEYAEAIFVASVFFLFLRCFVVQAYQIPSESMLNTLLVGDFLVANKFLYGARIPGTDYRMPAVRNPERGDIIVFRAPHQDKDFIKRCVAVEGDTVEVRNNQVILNGQPQTEEYVVIKEPLMGSARLMNWGPEVIPDGKLLMLGDNRNQSSDSRDWGLLDRSRVEGKALFLYFSFDKNRFLPRLGRFFRIIH